MGDGSRHFAQHSHARYMCEFRLRLAQFLFGVICADRRRNIGAGAPITKKITACVIKWLAACLDVYRRSRPTRDTVHEIAKRLMGVERLPMQPPFFSLRFSDTSNSPAGHSNSPT